MMHQAIFEKDPANKKMTVTRPFSAEIPLVWQAWTTAEILDQWWAPKPYKAVTHKMDFREGGSWHYAMVGPEGERHLCRNDYNTINPHESITAVDGFCNEQFEFNNDMPLMYWHMLFSEADGTTTVKIDITFDKAEDMETIVSMGFQEGFTAGLANLDEYLAGK